jgi:SAM-dependent methyltransferase
MNFWRRWKLALARAVGLDLTHCQVHYARFLDEQVPEGVTWLELGCGRQVIPEYAMPLQEQRRITSRASLLIGVDVDEAMRQHRLLSARAYALGGRLPFRGATFHLVTCNMVVEHFPNPEPVLADIYRVLKPGGRFIFHTPNYLYYLIFISSLTPERLKSWLVWQLERRKEEERFTTFYRMNTETTVSKIALAAGFEVEQLLHRGSNGTFERLWFIGWLECLILRALEIINDGAYRSNLIVMLRKPK